MPESIPRSNLLPKHNGCFDFALHRRPAFNVISLKDSGAWLVLYVGGSLKSANQPAAIKFLKRKTFDSFVLRQHAAAAVLHIVIHSRVAVSHLDAVS